MMFKGSLTLKNNGDKLYFEVLVIFHTAKLGKATQTAAVFSFYLGPVWHACHNQCNDDVYCVIQPSTHVLHLCGLTD